MKSPLDLSKVNGFEYGKGELVLSPASPLESARRLVKDRYTSRGAQILFRHRGIFYCWQHSHYQEVSHEFLRADVNLFLDCALIRSKNKKTDEWETYPFNPKTTQINEVIGGLQSISFLGDVLQPPFWLGDSVPDLEASEIVACANGLLHLPTRDLLPHTPAFFTHNAIDYEYDAKAPRPENWFRFLRDLWGDDVESVRTLQEIFGYCLVSDTSQQKAFMLVGPKRSGKGTIARILEAVIGEHNVVAPTLTGLGTNFGMAPLIGKRLAVISDARISGKADAAVIAERILAVTGEDAITLDRKNRDAWTGKLDVRFLLISNELPRLADASGALPSRFIVLILNNSFFGNEDRALINRLLPERPSILNWAIRGYARLCERGHFVQPASASDAIRDLEDLGSPMGAFVRDRCVIGQGKSVECSLLYGEWVEWCEAQGRSQPGTLQTFGRDLRAVVPGLRTSYPRAEDGRKRFYEGIGFI
jgi:putative DNA primase/helicase